MKKLFAIIAIVAFTGVSAFAANPEKPQTDEKKAGCATVENVVKASAGECESAANVVKTASLETKSACGSGCSSEAIATTAKAEGECSKKTETDTKVAENK